MRKASAGLFLLALLAFTGACGKSNGPLGPLAQLDELAFQPQTLSVGTANTVEIGFVYYAPNADLLFLFTQLEDPDGQLEPLTRYDIAGTWGYTDGELQFNIPITPAAPGTYHLNIWVKDSGGQDSNTLTADLNAS